MDKVSNDGAEDPDKSESKSSENTNGADDRTQNKDTTNKADETNKTENTNNESAYVDMDNEEFALADTPDAKPVFNWPLEGDIVMDFSSDALVYDATLEQYRTNDCICISASQGTPVKAAADVLLKVFLMTMKTDILLLFFTQMAGALHTASLARILP